MIQSGNHVDLVAIAALLSSIAFGILNFLYTKRTYSATNYPRLDINVEQAICVWGTCLRFRIRNLSPEKSALKGILTVHITVPDGKWYKPKYGMSPFYQQKNIEIEPQANIVLPEHEIESVSCIEVFIVKSYPDLVKLRRTSKGEELFFVKPKQYFDCVLHFEYAPSVFGAFPQKLKFKYRVIPTSKNSTDSQYRLNYWKIEKIGK